MSRKTIAEFDQDHAPVIEENGTEFLLAVLAMLRSGSQAPGVADQLRRFGIRVAPTVGDCHDRSVTIGGAPAKWL